MTSFRRVFGERAGPAALGILIPPGRKTVLILRPRALTWDLLLTQRAAEGKAIAPFREMTREEAELAAEQICTVLENWTNVGQSFLEATELSEEQGYCVKGSIGSFPVVACPRIPGKPYQPAIFSEQSEAQQAVDDLTQVLQPAGGSIQELYFNTRNFNR